MTRVYLSEAGKDYIIGNSNVEVYGTKSIKDSIILNEDVENIKVSSTVEILTLKDGLDDYQFTQGFGSNISILDNDDNLIATLTSVDGKTIRIDGEDFKLSYEDGVVKIGDTELSSEPIHIMPKDHDYIINEGGITLASDKYEEVFTIVSETSYTHRINNFDIFNDKLDFGDGITAEDLDITNTENDGKVILSYTPDMGSTIVKIELTGLDLNEDKLLTTKDGVNSILNGYTPPAPEPEKINPDYVNDEPIGDAGDTIDSATEVEFTDDLDLIIDGYFDDSDNYTFTASTDGILSIDLYDMDSNLDLFVYNSEGGVIASSENFDNSSENVSFDIRNGEKYTISINTPTVYEVVEGIPEEDEATESTTRDESSDDSKEETPEVAKESEESSSEGELGEVTEDSKTDISVETTYNLYAWIKEKDIDDDEDDYIYDSAKGDFISIGDAGDLESPTKITLNEEDNSASIHGYASSYDDDSDLYQFTATDNGTLYVNLTKLEDDLDLAILDDSKDIIDYSINDGTSEEALSIEVKEGETYIIDVSALSDDVSSSYDLSIFIA